MSKSALLVAAGTLLFASSAAAQDSTAADTTTPPPPSLFEAPLDPTTIEAAIRKGANVNETNDRGQTALMVAVQSEAPEAVGALLRANADVNVQDRDGDVALGLYLEGLFDPVPFATALIDKGAVVEAPNFEGVTPLMYASRGGTPELVEMLIAAGADPNSSDNAGDVPVGSYIINHPDPVPIAEVLLKHGADPRKPNATGVTPLFYAERWGSAALQALLQRGTQ